MKPPRAEYAEMEDEELVSELKKRAGDITRTLQEINRLLQEASHVE